MKQASLRDACKKRLWPLFAFLRHGNGIISAPQPEEPSYVNPKALRRIAVIAFSALALSHCAQNPVTGDKDFVLMSEQQGSSWARRRTRMC